VYETDGTFAPFDKSSGHIHSITSALSGIVRYAIFVNDTEMIDQCCKIMDIGVPQYFSSWGWGDEVMPNHPANVVAQGEINQTGDVIRAALYLGATGRVKYYELAERYLRSMLLPSQVWLENLPDIVKQNPAPKDDTERDTYVRCIGGYGFPRPNARMPKGGFCIETQDITSGGVHALAECWEHKLVMTKDGTCKLNLLFDASNPEFDITSKLPKQGVIEFTVKSGKTLSVRIPDWIDTKTLKLTLDGFTKPVSIKDGYLLITGLNKGNKGIISFDVPCKTEKETVDGTEYTTTWVGNQIIDIQPRGVVSPLPF
jgi:hypothetical protein